MTDSAAPPSPQADDLDALMRQAQQGDARAYAALLNSLNQLLHVYLLRRVRPSDREDVVQDILLSLHKARHTYTPERPFLPWAMAIARYRLTDHWRSHYRRHVGQTEPIENHAENLGHDVTERYEQSEDIRRALKGLSAKQQEILQQMYGEDLSVQEVADNLKMNVSAVKVAAHRAYKALRGKLGEG